MRILFKDFCFCCPLIITHIYAFFQLWFTCQNKIGLVSRNMLCGKYSKIWKNSQILAEQVRSFLSIFFPTSSSCFTTDRESVAAKWESSICFYPHYVTYILINNKGNNKLRSYSLAEYKMHDRAVTLMISWFTKLRNILRYRPVWIRQKVSDIL